MPNADLNLTPSILSDKLVLESLVIARNFVYRLNRYFYEYLPLACSSVWCLLAVENIRLALL